MHRLVEGKKVSVESEGGEPVPGIVAKVVKGILMVQLSGTVMDPGSRVRIWTEDRNNWDGTVSVASGQLVAIKLDCAPEQPGSKPVTRKPIIWLGPEGEQIIQLTDSSATGFSFESSSELPPNTELAFRIAVRGVFQTVRGRLTSLTQNEPDRYVGTIAIVSLSRLDQTEWVSSMRLMS